MNKAWLETMGKIVGIIVAIPTILGLAYGSYKFIFPNPVKPENFSANVVTMVASRDIDQVVSELDAALDAKGRPFNYKHDPTRIGYIVACDWGFSGRGKGELDFVVQDGSTDPPRILTKKTPVVTEVDTFGSAETFHTEFFVETGKLNAGMRPRLIIFISTTTGDQRSMDLQSKTLTLAVQSHNASAVALL
ncbi:MAG TPA: hypothetical protein VFE35_10900 [Candidatus Cybelea sp.]|jgi:hypothetical protein|nr:hypothetical protein [Candidatus Cybelea sp.]